MKHSHGTIALLLAACLALPLTAQDKEKRKQPPKPAVKSTEKKPVEKIEKKPGQKKPQKQPDKSGGMNKSREAAALAFVREHHPELESLLASLKEQQPKQYEAAIRDLFRHSERLAGSQEKDAARYELELKAWKLQSRVQLLTATFMMSPQDEAAKAKLKAALVEQIHARRELLQLERDHVAKRLEKLDEQIKKLQNDSEQAAERQLQAIVEGPKAKTSAQRVKGQTTTVPK
jgi:hypothetical protein